MRGNFLLNKSGARVIVVVLCAKSVFNEEVKNCSKIVLLRLHLLVAIRVRIREVVVRVLHVSINFHLLVHSFDESETKKKKKKLFIKEKVANFC